MMKISKCTSLLTPSKIDKALFKFLDIDRQKNILNFNYDKLNSLSKKEWLDYIYSIKFLLDEENKNEYSPQFSVNSNILSFTEALAYSPYLKKNIITIEAPYVRYYTIEENGELHLNSSDNLSKVVIYWKRQTFWNGGGL